MGHLMGACVCIAKNGSFSIVTECLSQTRTLRFVCDRYFHCKKRGVGIIEALRSVKELARSRVRPVSSYSRTQLVQKSGFWIRM